MAKWLHAARRRENCQSINMQFFFVFCCFIDGELVQQWMSYISIPSKVRLTSLSKRKMHCVAFVIYTIIYINCVICLHQILSDLLFITRHSIDLIIFSWPFTPFSIIWLYSSIFEWFVHFGTEIRKWGEKKPSNINQLRSTFYEIFSIPCRSWWTRLSFDFVGDVWCEMCHIQIIIILSDRMAAN